MCWLELGFIEQIVGVVLQHPEAAIGMIHSHVSQTRLHVTEIAQDSEFHLPKETKDELFPLFGIPI